ncbi:hypothetical protein SprV_1002850500 [Sparganum proliferum]
MEQLQQRGLKQDETLNQLVEDLERLTTVAFPSLGSADKDNTVLYYFIKALPTSDLSRSLLLQPPENVQEAVTRAERYLRLCPPTSRPLPPEDAHVRDAHPTSAGRGSRSSSADLKPLDRLQLGHNCVHTASRLPMRLLNAPPPCNQQNKPLGHHASANVTHTDWTPPELGLRA